MQSGFMAVHGVLPKFNANDREYPRMSSNRLSVVDSRHSSTFVVIRVGSIGVMKEAHFLF
jgi:hypothetical protein